MLQYATGKGGRGYYMKKGLLRLLPIGMAVCLSSCGNHLSPVDFMPAVQSLTDDWNDVAYTGYSVILHSLEGELESFHEGYAAVRMPGSRRIRGFMNGEGKICMEGNYAPSEQRLCADGIKRQTNRFDGECIVVKETSANTAPVYYWLYPDGRKEKMPSYSFLTDTPVEAVPDTDYFIVRCQQSGLYGIADRDSQWHMQPAYTLLQYLAPDRYIAVKRIDERTTLSGIINSEGSIICDFQYEHLYAADQDQTYPFVYAKLSGGTNSKQYQLLSFDGIPLLDRPADDVSLSFQSPGIKIGDNWYLLSPDGSYSTDVAFDQPVEKEGPLRRAKSDGKWGYIDKDGDFVIAPRFSHAGKFSEGLASVITPVGSGYINESGEYVIPPKYDYAYPFCGGKALVYTRTNAGRSSEGAEYEAAIISAGGAVLKNKLKAVSFVSKIGDYYQLLDENGNYRLYTASLDLALISPYEITKVETDELTGQNLYIVEYQGWNGLINCMGNVILSPEESLCPSSCLKWLGEGYLNMNGKLIHLD